MINLILALAWLLFGLGMLVWSLIEPERAERLPGLHISFLYGGAFLLALYNLVRWWLSRARGQVDWMGRPFPPRNKPRVVEYNPDLDFSGPPKREEPNETNIKSGEPPGA